MNNLLKLLLILSFPIMYSCESILGDEEDDDDKYPYLDELVNFADNIYGETTDFYKVYYNIQAIDNTNFFKQVRYVIKDSDGEKETITDYILVEDQSLKIKLDSVYSQYLIDHYDYRDPFDTLYSYIEFFYNKKDLLNNPSEPRGFFNFSLLVSDTLFNTKKITSREIPNETWFLASGSNIDFLTSRYNTHIFEPFFHLFGGGYIPKKLDRNSKHPSINEKAYRIKYLYGMKDYISFNEDRYFIFQTYKPLD